MIIAHRKQIKQIEQIVGRLQQLEDRIDPNGPSVGAFMATVSREVAAALHATREALEARIRELSAEVHRLKEPRASCWICENVTGEPSKEMGMILAQIIEERRSQDRQWGGADHDDGHDRSDWPKFIAEHNDRAIKMARKIGTTHANGAADEYRKQLIEIAALAVAAIESHDRKPK